MRFAKLSSKAKELLDDILSASNPTDMLSKRFDSLSGTEDNELRTIIRELRECGYISVNWADNRPYRIVINSSAKTYEERLREYEATVYKPTLVIDQSIKLGNNNKIKNSTIAHKNNLHSDEKITQKTFAEKHPIILSIAIGLLTGFILLFSFWEKIINWIEGLF